MGKVRFSFSYDQWVQIGLDLGYCGPAVCATHDGIPTSEQEDSAVEEGDDPCLHVLRLYVDKEHKDAVESNHAPSIWRDPYR